MPYAVGVNLCSWIQDTSNLLDSHLTLPLLCQKCGKWNWHCEESCYKYHYHYIISLLLFLYYMLNLNHSIIMKVDARWWKVCALAKGRTIPLWENKASTVLSWPKWPMTGSSRRIPAHLNACLQGLTGCMVVGGPDGLYIIYYSFEITSCLAQIVLYTCTVFDGFYVCDV